MAAPALSALAFDGRPCANAARMAARFGKVRPYRRTWMVDFGRFGKVYSLHGATFESEQEAEWVLRAVQGMVAEGTPKAIAVDRYKPTASSAHRISKWLALWLEDLEALERSGDRSPNYLRDVKRWTKPGPHGYIAALGPTSLHLLNYARMRKWQAELGDLGVRGKTLWNVTAALSAFLGWCVKASVLTVKPPVPWPSIEEYVPEIILPEVQDRILAAIPRDRVGVFMAMRMLALRHSEAFVVDGADYRDGRIWVRHARKGRSLGAPVRGTKGRRPRVLFVPDELAAWIAAHVPTETLLKGGPIFRNPRTGRAWTASSFRRTWARACKAAGFDMPLNSYESLRHSTATEWMRKGARQREVQALLGHKTAHATPRYARLADGRLETIVGRKDGER